MANFRKMEFNDVVEGLCNESVNINDLLIEKIDHRNAFFKAIERRPALLRKIGKNCSNAQTWLKLAIEQNFENFVYLNQSQYTNPLAQTFLYNRLVEKKQANNKEGLAFNISKSLDNLIIFNCSYTTPDGEELFYLDSELKLPIGLKSAYKLAIKLVDAVKFIKKLDIHITLLGKNKIETAIEDIIGNLYKTTLSAYIKKNKKGFYELTTSYSDIEEMIMPKLNSELEDFGFEVNSFIIKAIAIPKDIQYKIEDQAFEIRHRLEEALADETLSKKSLENYEAKLSIEHKYPNATPSLTEHEKDLALRRYMMRTGKNKEDIIDHNIDISQKQEKNDREINQEKDIVPEIKPSNFKSNYFTALVICVLVSLFMLAVQTSAGLVFLVITTVIFALVAIFNINKFITPTPEFPPYETDLSTNNEVNNNLQDEE